jgi:hypothetical protein
MWETLTKRMRSLQAMLKGLACALAIALCLQSCVAVVQCPDHPRTGCSKAQWDVRWSVPMAWGFMGEETDHGLPSVQRRCAPHPRTGCLVRVSSYTCRGGPVV